MTTKPFKSGSVGAVWLAEQLGVHRDTAREFMRARGAVPSSLSGGRLRLPIAEGLALVEELREVESSDESSNAPTS